MLEKIFDFIAGNAPAVAAGGTSSGLMIAGAAGQAPEGIHPIVYLVGSVVAPMLTALVYSQLRVMRARRKARKDASGAEHERLAAEYERVGLGKVNDTNPANDEEGRKLLAKAREERMEAAADRAEAEQIQREQERSR